MDWCPGTDADLADGDFVRGDLSVHRCADGDDVNFGLVKTSDASWYLSDMLRHLQQLLPDTVDSVERGDTTPREAVPTLRSLRLDTDSHGNRWKPFRGAVFESYTSTFPLGMWMRRLMPWTLADIPRASTEM